MRTRARSRCLEAAAWSVLLAALPTVAFAARERGPGEADVEPVVVGLTVNGTVVSDAQMVYRDTGIENPRIWLPLDAARSWRLELSGRALRDFEGESHAAFCEAREGCLFDESAALLTVTAPPADFMPLRIEPPSDALVATSAAGAGGYLNYDVSTWKYGRAGMSALLDGHLYSRWGHGAVGLGSVYTGGHGTRALGRAIWQVDQPQRGRSFQFGSIAIPDTALGAGLPLTGLRVGSNAQLDPRSPPALRPIVDGLVDRPTRTDVFVDGLFRQTAQIPYGPYSIELLPQASGRGDIEVVTTDPGGLQTRVRIPYYQAPSMLRPGASEWSLDGGVLADDGLRRDVSAARPVVASGTWRLGLARWLTGQGQLLLSPKATRLMAGADTVDARWGTSSFGLVWQRSPSQRGGRAWLGAGHEFTSRDVSASLRGEQVIGACAVIGSTGALTDRLSRPCRHVSALVGASFGSRWSASAAADLRRDADGRSGSVLSLGARLQLAASSQVAINVQQVRVDGRSVAAIQLTYSRPIGGRYAAQAGFERRTDTGNAATWAVQQIPSPDAQAADGLRFQANGSAGERSSDANARWSDDAERFSWRSEVRVDRRGASGAGGIAGAVGFAEGRVFSTRRINDSFVLVEVGLAGLPVLLDNREVARTNGDGWAVVTGARARQENNIAVDVSALPIRYAMPRDQQSVVPGIASGALARFDLSDGGVALPVRDGDGEKLTPGSVARVSTQTLPTAVTSRSEVFVDRSDRAATITIEFAGRRCGLRYDPDAPQDGAYRCLAP